MLPDFGLNSPAPFHPPGFILIKDLSRSDWICCHGYPQMIVAACSIRTLSSFSSVSHTPTGVFAD